MNPSQVAGLLVLLGVVGLLAAIVGSGVEAGPVKFPSIPGSRQKPLAVASVLVIAGGAIWWAFQRPAETSVASTGPAATTRAGASGDTAGSQLRVILLPASANLRLGSRLSVGADVHDADGGLGPGQCVITWRDSVAGAVVHFDTTDCNGPFVEDGVAHPGVHRITARAEGTADIRGAGSQSVDVAVTK